MATPSPTPDGNSQADAASVNGELQRPTGPSSTATRAGSPAASIPDHELLRCIGRGAYGSVWLARNVMGTLRAVKLVHREDFSRDRPFTREYEGLLHYEPISRSHPNLMQILHVGRHDEFFYYVTELADDASEISNLKFQISNPAAYLPRTLQAELEQRGRLPVRECVSLATALASALKHLHDRKLVHRDVKPSNVIFVHGVPKLADIGLVATVGDSQSIVGTEGYLPPEGPGTLQADLYALGILLYELATGMKRADYPRLPLDLRDWPDAAALLEFNEVLLRACARDVDQRYRHADELLADLAVLERGASVKRLRRLERHHTLIRRVGIGMLAVGLLVSAAWWQSWRAHRVARQHLARLHASEGTQRMVRGDYVAALPWLVGALELAAGDPAFDSVHRIRIANVLKRCPFPVAWFNVPESRVLAADLSPDDTRLATAHEDGIVRVWDLRSGACVRCLPHQFPVVHCQWLPGGDRLLTGTVGQQAHIWDLEDAGHSPRTFSQSFEFGGAGYALGLNEALLPAGWAYLAKARYRFARLHPLSTSFENLTFSLKLIGQGECLTVQYEIRPTTPGPPAVCAGEFRDTPEVDPFDSGGDAPAAPLWGRAFVLMDNGSIGRGPNETSQIIWDNLKMRRYPTEATPPPWRIIQDFSAPELTNWLHVMPRTSRSTIQVIDGQLVLSSQNLPTQSLGWPCTGPLELFEVTPEHTLELEVDLISARAPLRQLSLSVYRPNLAPFDLLYRPLLVAGRWLILVRRFDVIRIWDLDQGKFVSIELNGDEAPLELQLTSGHLAFEISPDLKILAQVDAGYRCSLWDLERGRELDATKLAAWRTSGLQFSPDGRFLALTHEEGLELIRPGDWEPLQTMESSGLCRLPHFSPHGSRLAAVRHGREVLAWDLGELTAPPAVFAHAFPVRNLVFSPDGRYLACGTANDQVQVWDIMTGTAFGQPLPGRLGGFNADGRRLLLSNPEGGVTLWDLSRVADLWLAVPPHRPGQGSARSTDGRIAAHLEGNKISVTTPTDRFTLATPLEMPLHRVAVCPDDRHLIAESPDRRAWAWDLHSRILAGPPWPIRYDASLETHRLPELAADARSPSDLADLASVLAGQRPDGMGGMMPVEPAERERLRTALRRAYPTEFGLSDTHRTRWHREHAEAAEEAMDWEAAVFHWENLLKSPIPNPQSSIPPASRLAYARAAAERVDQFLRQGNSRWSVILPRPPQATSAMLDLEPFYTQPLGVTTAANPGSAPFRLLAAKVHQLHGTGFDVRGIVQLHRGTTVSVPVNRPCHRVHFLHAASQSTTGLRETAAGYRVHFAEDDSASVQLSNPEDLPPYLTSPFLSLAQRAGHGTSPKLQSTLAWSGIGMGPGDLEAPVFLTRTTWEISDLPAGRWVTNLELQAGSADSVPLIFAITVE